MNPVLANVFCAVWLVFTFAYSAKAAVELCRFLAARWKQRRQPPPPDLRSKIQIRLDCEDGHCYLFRYLPGEEEAIVAAAEKLAADGRMSFDAGGVAVLKYTVGLTKLGNEIGTLKV